MLTLNDGRTELWQWDTGRKLTVDADCTQVHFSNKVFGRSIDADVVDGAASIPDILLQIDNDLTAWAFVGTAENGYTKISKVFKVNKRNKPADYVFTPPEQTTLGEILERLDRIQESQDPDAIKNAVDYYLANNPVKIEEIDPTVPDWAKEKEKPKYTAKEVGAVATVNGISPDANGNVEIPVSGGNVDLTGYATEQYVKDYAQPKGDYALRSEIPSVPVKSVNGKTGAVSLTATDVKARPDSWMPTASDVGALPSSTVIPTVPTKVSEFTNDAGYLTEHQDLSEYAKKTEIPSVPVKSVNGKTGAVSLTASDVKARPDTWMPSASDVGALPSSTVIPTVPTKLSAFTNDSGFITGYTETDPTVPAWAKAATKPTYTASEVGADASGTASSAVSAHNAATDAHTDIREQISQLSSEKEALTEKINEIEEDVIDIKAESLQQVPLFANSIEECTDTSKLYVLPDGYIYAYMLTEVEEKPSYTNVLKTAQTSATDTTPFNATGYQVDKGFKSDGTIEDTSSFATQQSGGKNLITGFIPITPTDKIYFDNAYIYKFSSTRFHCWYYDKNGTKLRNISPNTLNSGTWASAATMGSSNNVVCLDMAALQVANSSFSDVQYAKFIRFTLQTDGSDPSEAVITINEPITAGGGTVTEYAFASTGIPFVSMDAVNLLNEQVEDHGERIGVLEEQANAVRIIAPPKLTVLAGHELNVYTDNMILCDNVKNYEVRWSFTGDLNGKAIAMEDCLRFPATITSEMTDIATLRVRDKATGTLITSAQIPVEVIAETSLSGKNVLFIGDSLTEATYYPAEIQNNLSGGGITSLGTRSNYIYINEVGMRVPHEGRSGWSVANYLSAESYNGATNAFYNPDSGAFDFSYYMTQQGYSAVDAVCIGLGTNGVTAVESNVSGINTMIDSIHAYNHNIKVFVALITPPAVQDGWRNIQNTDEWKRQQLSLVEAYITAFANRTDNVSVIPWYVAINRAFDFPRIDVAESARNPVVITRANNGVHPSVYGYLKMADMLYSILVSELA